METIYALASGRPPAAIAVVRVSGPRTMEAVTALAGSAPPPRRASLRTLRDAEGSTLDQALVLTFPGPNSATGEDLAEFHLHGGRAVVDAVLRALAQLPGMRAALPGEFTRRSLINGRVDLAQAQGLADLLEAETDQARRAALAATEGKLSREVQGWMERLSEIAAFVEAELDHSDEDDVEDHVVDEAYRRAVALREELDAALRLPSVARLRDGPLIVLAGPPNAGKSSLFNALLEREAAIVTPIAGTTRDVIEVSVVRNGMAYRLVDTAGLADETSDPVEQIGIRRASNLISHADTILWLGDPDAAPDRSIVIAARADLEPESSRSGTKVSVHWPDTVSALWQTIEERHGSRASWDAVHFHDHQRERVGNAVRELGGFLDTRLDLLVRAEHLRYAQRALAALLGVNATEAVLDTLFARFCIGK